MTDIKYKYWAVNIYLDNYHYLIFDILKIGQILPTHMSQRAKISAITFGELINIVSGIILLFQSKLLIFYRKIAKNIASLTFYKDNAFETFKIYQKKYIFLHDHFFLYIIWFKLNLEFSRLKIRITKIFALEKLYKIDRRIKLNLDNIGKIFT